MPIDAGIRSVRGGGGRSRRVTFAIMRAFLESGAPWPDEPRPECIDTHASLVCLTRDRAWKLKKPVHLIHVDQRTLEIRERLCREEVRLNREMSGDVYRGLRPLVQRPDGCLALGGPGRVVDWLIESVRLPATEMLDHRLAFGPVPGAAEIERLCDVLVGFYRARAPAPDGGDTFYRRLRRDSWIAREHLREMAPSVDLKLSLDILESADDMVRRCHDEIIERGRRGLIFEGHGDLRAEHVCLTEVPVLFDRLEIDHGLRTVDPFFEVNALGLECGLLRARWIRPRLLDRLGAAFVPPSRQLLTAYGVVASLTRARLAVDHFRDSVVPTPDKYRSRTLEYLDVATALAGHAPAD